MNERQKETAGSILNDEKAVIKSLQQNCTASLVEVKKKIKELQANPLTQSIAYQLDFQKQLEKQLSGIIDVMTTNNFTSIDDYLNTCYKQGFLSTMYDLQGQGVPLVLPIDQEKVLKAVSKTGDDVKLANKLNVSTKELKKQVLSELQRGLATQLSYTDIARNISAYGEADMHRSMRIARTEGHRVQNEAKMDSLHGAKGKGADIVKQWDCTLDGDTRETHRALDGQIKEIDEPFQAAGKSAMYPGGFGDPAEDCNCRCCVLQRAKWAVQDETTYQKWNNETGGIIECSGYDDFKQKYITAEKKLKPAKVKPITDEKEAIKAAQTFDWDKGQTRGYHKKNGVMSDYGHAMFADGDIGLERGSFPGDMVALYDGKIAVDIDTLDDIVRLTWEQDASNEFKGLNENISKGLKSYNSLSTEEIIDSFKTNDIIDTANSFDDEYMTVWFKKRVAEPNNIKAVRVGKGSIVFDENGIQIQNLPKDEAMKAWHKYKGADLSEDIEPNIKPDIKVRVAEKIEYDNFMSEMKKKYGEESMWSKMTDAEYSKQSRLETALYGK